MEGKEVKLEDEVHVLKQRNEEPEKSIRNGEDDDASGTPPTNTPPEQQHTDVEKHKRGRICEFNPCKRSTRKRLDFGAAGSSHDNISPSSSADHGTLPESSLAYDKVKRERPHKIKWKNLDAMLADLETYPKLCMRAICALWRLQTPKERSRKATIERNDQGFDCDGARIGSEIAEFLTDGDPRNDVMKSLQELQDFKPNWFDTCREIVMHHRWQLFRYIYEGDVDPYFHLNDLPEADLGSSSNVLQIS